MIEPPFMPEWAWNAVLTFLGAILGAVVATSAAWVLERKRMILQAEEAERRFAVALYAELELLLAGVEASIQKEDALATMTTLASLRPAVTAFFSNTDKVGVFREIEFVPKSSAPTRAYNTT